MPPEPIFEMMEWCASVVLGDIVSLILALCDWCFLFCALCSAFLSRSGYAPQPRVAASATLGFRSVNNRNAVASNATLGRFPIPDATHSGLKIIFESLPRVEATLGCGTQPLCGKNAKHQKQSTKRKLQSNTSQAHEGVGRDFS